MKLKKRGKRCDTPVSTRLSWETRANSARIVRVDAMGRRIYFTAEVKWQLRLNDERLIDCWRVISRHKSKETAVNALEQFLSEDQQKNKKRS